MDTIVATWESFRPKQWTKNFFLFAGILFSQNFFNPPLLIKNLFAFLIFCLLSSAVYILNDLIDIEKDRLHRVKSQRPLASGRLSKIQAIILIILLTSVSLFSAFLLDLPFFSVALAYYLLHLAYSFLLHQIVILDVFAIASGFVLRVVAGAVVIQVEISSWLIICTMLLSLFLGLSKRRHELVLLEHEAKNHRKVLEKYSPYLLDQMISVVTASTVVSYALYTMSAETIEKFGTKNLIFTIPFVLYGIFRYLYLIHKKEEGGNPENLLVSDAPLMVNILLWVLTAGLILYL